MDHEIPDKLYFKIGEVATLTGVKPHVLRYWESEFSCFRPTKSRSKQRLYSRDDIELALKIKELLHQRGFTVAGARKVLGRGGPQDVPDPRRAQEHRELIREIRQDLQRLRIKLTETS